MDASRYPPQALMHFVAMIALTANPFLLAVISTLQINDCHLHESNGLIVELTIILFLLSDDVVKNLTPYWIPGYDRCSCALFITREAWLSEAAPNPSTARSTSDGGA